MEEIGKLLPTIFKRQVRRTDPKVVEILAPLWTRVVGKGIAQQSRPAAFEAGTLTIVTSCLTWATQLRQMSEEVRAQVNNCLGGVIVKKLRVRVILEVGPAETCAPQESVAVEGGPAPQRLPEGAAQLEPEITGMLERSYAKYFARQKTKAH